MDDRTLDSGAGGAGAGDGRAGPTLRGSGARIGGRYELGELLGRGGMAEVRRATDVRLGRTVAVKRLRVDLATDPTFQARFRREAQSAAGLNHPNIVAVYDTGEEMAADGSHVQPYIVMEYVAGRTLRDVLNDDRKVLPERALEIISGVLEALDYSHRAGIVHRDIKPANVMLTPQGEVKVMDFGIARAIADGGATVTQTAAVVGTAQYLSPEQARGETVDSRSDVYSTGCLLYEMLAGRPPFVGDSAFSVAYQHVREHPEPPSAHNPDLPPEIDAILMKSLAKRVEDRYSGAAEMQADIRRFLDGEPPEAPTAFVAPVATAGAEPTSIFRPLGADDTVEGEEERPRRSRRWLAWLLGVVLLALVVAAVVWGLSQLFADEPADTTVPSVTNMTLAQAERRLEAEGLELGDVTRETSEDVGRNRIISQDPESGQVVEEGSAIDLVVSEGSEMVVVPSVIGTPRGEAARLLEDRGLQVSFEERDSDEPRDIVIETDPVAGEEVEKGSTVTVVVSTGPVRVPDVVGEDEDTAVRTLEDAGFDVQVTEDETTPAEPDTVLSQSPGGGEEATRGSTVEIVVSRFEEPEPTQSPTETPTESPTESPTDGSTDGGGTDGGGTGGGGGGGGG